MQPHKIDELFKSAIDSSEESPASDIWENIEKNLDQHNLITIKRKYSNLKGIAIALVLLLFSVFLYELQTQHITYQPGKFDKKPVSSALQSTPSGAVERKNKEIITGDKQNSVRSSADQMPYLTEKTLSDRLLFGRANNPVVYEKAIIKASNNSGDQFSTFLHLYSNGNDNLENPLQKNKELNSFNLQANSETPLLPAIPSAINLNYGNSNLSQYPDFINILNSDELIARNNDHNSSLVQSSTASSAVSLGREKSRFAFTLMFSPDFTTRVIKADWQINREDNRDEIRKSERYAFSYSFGGMVDYKINSHWGIQSGLEISRAVINIKPKFIFARPDSKGLMQYKFNSSSGYSYISPKDMIRPAFGDSINVSGSSSSLQYASIPITVKYNFGKKKLKFNVMAGLAANFLLKEKVETSLYHAGGHDFEITKHIIGLKPVYYSAIVAAGASYNVSKTLAVSVTPTSRLALTSINKDAPVKSYQNSLGLVAGIQLSF